VTFKVILQPVAEEEIEAAFLYLASEASLETAVRWYNELETAIATLDQMPRRCSLASENDFFEEEIRQLLVAPYRVLFTILGNRVHLLHVRHTARRTLGVEDDP
jgi:plasmid stabilization system protein ParE